MIENVYPDRLKPARVIYAKVKDYNKVTASGRTWLTWGVSVVKRPPTYGAPQLLKDFRSEASANQSLGTMEFGVVSKNSGYCVSTYLSHIITIFQTFKIRGVMPLAGHHPITFNLSLCPFIWSSHLFCLHYSLLFLMLILKAKKIKTFSCPLKCIYNRYIFFELMSRRSKHQHLSQGQLNSAREVWPNVVRWPVSKKKKSSLSRKPERAA